MKKHNILIIEVYQINGSYSFAFGVQGAKKLLSLAESPTGLFFCHK
jgi:LacI family transcriptional regulator